MGGKGRRRREKNYMAAHGGGNSRLPPPPDPSSVDAVPSKLRKILSLAGAVRKPSNGNNQKNSGKTVEKEVPPGEGYSVSAGSKRKRNDEKHIVEHDKKKKKRKKKKADDLRFVAADESGSVGSQRKARRKQRSEARKNKHKKSGSEEDVDFPGHELVKFGDVVQAPPKLTSVPKGSKTTQDASQERLRLQAVDAYRKRKAWESRPGGQLPPLATTSSLF